jgi:hypothetical protein
MKMKLHSIPHQKGKYNGLSKPQDQNGDSVEKVDGHQDPYGLFTMLRDPPHTRSLELGIIGPPYFMM